MDTEKPFFPVYLPIWKVRTIGNDVFDCFILPNRDTFVELFEEYPYYHFLHTRLPYVEYVVLLLVYLGLYASYNIVYIYQVYGISLSQGFLVYNIIVLHNAWTYYVSC